MYFTHKNIYNIFNGLLDVCVKTLDIVACLGIARQRFKTGLVYRLRLSGNQVFRLCGIIVSFNHFSRLRGIKGVKKKLCVSSCKITARFYKCVTRWGVTNFVGVVAVVVSVYLVCLTGNVCLKANLIFSYCYIYCFN